MNEINSRVAEVIRDSKLTKTAFAAKLNISQPTVSQICSGLCGVSDRVISDICRVFAINETWLRTGVGEMHVPMSRDAQLAKIFAAVQVSDDERARLVKGFASLPEEAYPQIYKWFLEMAKNLTGE